jgi:hypothetical protein
MLETNTGGKAIIPDAFKVSIEFSSLTMDVNNFLIPEMGTAWIDVNQRFGINSKNKSTQNQTVQSTITIIQSNQTVDGGSKYTTANSGNASTSQSDSLPLPTNSDGRSIMFGGGFSPLIK